MKKLVLLGLMLSLSNTVFASAELAKSKNCMACHSLTNKLVGPSFKDVAKRYNGSDEAKLTSKVLKGGSGEWGFIPMPANTQLNDKEAQILVQWILNNK